MSSSGRRPKTILAAGGGEAALGAGATLRPSRQPAIKIRKSATNRIQPPSRPKNKRIKPSGKDDELAGHFLTQMRCCWIVTEKRLPAVLHLCKMQFVSAWLFAQTGLVISP